jgi:hypothetical protein
MFQTRFSNSKRALPLLGLAVFAGASHFGSNLSAKLRPQAAIAQEQPVAQKQPVRVASREAHEAHSEQTSASAKLAQARLKPVPGAAAGSFEEMSRIITRAQWNDLTVSQRAFARDMLLDARAGKPAPHFCFRPGTPTAQMRALEAVTHALAFTPNFQPTYGRWGRTATDPSIPRNQPFTLTWNLAFDSDKSDIRAWAKTNFGSEEGFREKVRAMFALWSTYVPITYVEVDYDDGVVDRGELGIRPDIRISGVQLPEGVIGRNGVPEDGDMVLDTKTGYLNPSNDSNGERLFNCMAHEHGHGIGLNHTCPPDNTKVMEPQVNSNFHGPQFDDILSAQFHYGDAYEKGSRNNAPSTASNLGTMALNSETVIRNVSLNVGDVDLYKITPDNDQRSVTAVLKPAGFKYLEAAQAEDTSCPPGVLFDPTTTRDLVLKIVNANGIELASSPVTTAGGQVSIVDFDLTGAGPYYAQVSTPNNEDKIQAYTLSLKIGRRKNRPPVISNFGFTPKRPNTNDNLTVTYKVTDPDEDGTAVEFIWKKNGQVVQAPNNSIDLSVEGNGDIGDIFEVTLNVRDTAGSTSTATIKVVIRPANEPPVFPDATFKTAENKVLNNTLKATDPNSKDPNAEEPLKYEVLTQPANGTVTVSPDGKFTYTPKLNFNGSDSFQARVSDLDGAFDDATIKVEVTPVNNTPVLQDDALSTKEDVALTISASTLFKNDNNGENKSEVDPMSIISVKPGRGFAGTLKLDKDNQTIQFTPELNWNGRTTFTYTVEDSGKKRSTATVTLDVVAVNDAPTAKDLKTRTYSGTPVEIELIGDDVEGDVASFSVKEKPTHGKAVVSQRGGKWYLIYTPEKDFVGTDSLIYRSRDGFLSSAPATITFTVSTNIPPQLNGVTLTPDSGIYSEGDSVVFTQQVRDSNGVDHLDAVSLLISSGATSTSSKNGAALWYDVVNNAFTMSTDDGKSTYTPVKVGQKLYNSQMSVELRREHVTRNSNSSLILEWHVTFKKGFIGKKTLWSFAQDLGGASAGYLAKGSIQINPPTGQPPVVPSANNS